MAYQSRWQEECFGRCNNCTNCTQNKTEDSSYKRFVTMGSVRYGMRVGAVSPPPPGAGPRYRSQCCWPSSAIDGSTAGPVSRIPLITTTPINNLDIISCANRMRMTDDDDDDNNDNNGDDGDPTSELPQQTTVCNHVFYSKKCFKNQLKNCALVKPQIYTRLCEYSNNYEQNIFNNLDRLPRFRFGGNRASNKTNSDHRLRDFTDRLKRGGPIPPPRIRHSSARTVPSTTTTISTITTTTTAVDSNSNTTTTITTTTTTTTRLQEPSGSRTTPFRSASFSQVDYNPDDRKYFKRKQSDNKEQEKYTIQNIIATLPRSKNITRSLSYQQNFEKHCDQSDVKIFENVDQPQQQSLMNPIGQSTENKHQNQPVVRDYMKSTVNAQEKKRDKSRRRKGIYISQWPNEYHSDGMLPHLVQDSDFADCSAQNSKLLQESIAEITKLQISDDKSKDFPIWSSPQEEPLSPEENNNNPPEWTLKIDETLPSLSPQPAPPTPPPLPTIVTLQRESSPLLQRSRSLSPPLVVSTSSSSTPPPPPSSPPPPPPPPPPPTTAQLKINLLRSDSLSEGEPEMNERKSDQQLTPSDVSDCECRTNSNNNKTNHNNEFMTPRRYSKRPLRGPYGQMLEAEMKKPERKLNHDLQFLEDLSKNDKKTTKCRNSSNNSLDTNANNLNTKHQNLQLTKRKVSADSLVVDNEQKLIINHQRTTSSPSKLESISNVQVSNELLEQLLRGSSEQLTTSNTNLQQKNDTRTHVVVELYENEKIYVESLEILVKKYLEPLKNPDNANLLDATLVDEIFNQIPALLHNHQTLLDELRTRLDHWDVKQKIGDVFLDMFSKQSVIDNYTTYVNNWKKAREIIKNAQASKTAFAKFLEATAREHKGKLALDSLLIKPIQKFPKYELLLTRLLKHTDIDHPDHNLLKLALKAVHDQLLKINSIEREALELEQLREIESLIDGLMNLVQTNRQYLRHDLVSMAARGGARKGRTIFLFSDLLLITKRKSGIRRPTTSGCNVGVGGATSVTNSFESNKYKLLMKISLDDLEIVRPKDENLKQIMLEIENLTEDVNILNQINELCWSLHCNHSQLDDVVKDMLATLNKQLTDQQNSDSQLCCLDLTLSTTNSSEIVSISFAKPEKRLSWEESFTDAKNKLVSGNRRPSPELLATVPIRKTRAGLQFTCAAPTFSDDCKDVWVCNSDGYVGQICVLSLQPEPTVTSCNGVCNARILCIASVPGISYRANNSRQDTEQRKTIHFDSSSSSDEDDRSDYGDVTDMQKMSESDACSVDIDDIDSQQSTMWLGTEDGSIHIYNSNDNIRIKKNKIKLQYNSSVLCIVYVDNRVFVSLSNGDIMIYERDNTGGWAINASKTVTISSSTLPVTKMLPNNGKLLCSCGNMIKIFNTQSLIIENSFQINNDTNKPITCIVLFGNGVWLSLQNSAIVRCFHIITFENLYEINVAPAVTKMLTSCDDIIRQHKAACLRVTALLACKDLLWIGTSAGVLLTMPLPHIGTTTTKTTKMPTVNGVSHGHTGHVRFLTYIELNNCETPHQSHRTSYRGKPEQRNNTKFLVISGGDGYEDFRNSNISEIAGREDSTNHLLLWNV